jgi:cysteine desulfurase / selenocysteine lyase
MKEVISEIVKEEFGELKSHYFNAAYFGPSPLRSKRQVEKSLSKEVNPSFIPYKDWYQKPEISRKLFAELLGVSSDEVFHSCSVSDINNILIHGLELSENDVVTVVNKDYPSNVLPFLLNKERNKNKLQLLDLPLEDLPTSEWLHQKISPDTKVFCISWVTFDTGKRIDLVDLGKYLKSKNIFFIVDCTQGLGGLKLKPEELELIDAISCASYKWLLGPYGHAFGYISKNAKFNIIHNNANWITSLKSTNVQSLLDYTTDTLPGARKFDRGQTANLLATSCLEKSLELLLEVGLEKIEKYNQDLVRYFIKNLSTKNLRLITPTENPSNILCFKVLGDKTSRLEEKLTSNNIDVSIREGSLRLSFHLYNSKAQVEFLLNIVNSF